VKLVRIAAVAAAGFALAAAVPATADDAVPGHAVLARASEDALVLWDASTVVATIVRSKMSDADANALLERDAARVLATIAPNVDKGAKSVTVRVIYSMTGDVSPVYGTPTFAGIERYATLTVTGPDVRSDRDRWKELDAKAALPAWFAYKIVGKLPPRA
jgi:hypothetical protein